MSRLVNETNPLKNWSDLRVQLLWIYDGPVKQFSSCLYPSNPIAAWLIRRGKVTLELPTGRETYSAGRWLFPPALEGWQEFSKDAEILSVRFIAQWPTGMPLFDRPKSFYILAHKLLHFTRIGERLSRFVYRHFDGATFRLGYANATSPEHYFELQRLLYGWILEYARIMKEQGFTPNSTVGNLNARVRHAIHCMENQILSRPLREKELAQTIGISIPQMNRLFVRDLGKTPIEYWENKRIAAARLALAESSRSIKAIAYDLGFASLSHFSSWTRKKLGKSPRLFRKETAPHSTED